MIFKQWNYDLIFPGKDDTYWILNAQLRVFVNSRRTCAVKVTVLGVCVCVYDC